MSAIIWALMSCICAFSCLVGNTKLGRTWKIKAVTAIVVFYDNVFHSNCAFWLLMTFTSLSTYVLKFAELTCWNELWIMLFFCLNSTWFQKIRCFKLLWAFFPVAPLQVLKEWCGRVPISYLFWCSADQLFSRNMISNILYSNFYLNKSLRGLSAISRGDKRRDGGINGHGKIK